MDKPIKPGDLVMVVRGPHCCNDPRRNGLIFRVESIGRGEKTKCRYCGAQRTPVPVASGGQWGFYLNRLKRIPPLEELEGERTQEDIREPA